MQNSKVKTKYEILEHKADLKIRAYGSSLEELFNNILTAISEATKPEILKDRTITTKIEIQAENLENLLVDFLSEVIYQMDLNNAVYLKVNFEKLTENELKGEILGEKIKTFETEIKAITWHDLEIKKQNNFWQATMVFDI